MAEKKTPAEKLAEQKQKAKAKVKRGAPRPIRHAVFSTRLKELRTAHGLTLRDVAEALGCSNSAIHEAERGYNVSLQLAMGLARLYGKRIEEIWEPLEQA